MPSPVIRLKGRNGEMYIEVSRRCFLSPFTLPSSTLTISGECSLFLLVFLPIKSKLNHSNVTLWAQISANPKEKCPSIASCFCSSSPAAWWLTRSSFSSVASGNRASVRCGRCWAHLTAPPAVPWTKITNCCRWKTPQSIGWSSNHWTPPAPCYRCRPRTPPRTNSTCPSSMVAPSAGHGRCPEGCGPTHIGAIIWQSDNKMYNSVVFFYFAREELIDYSKFFDCGCIVVWKDKTQMKAYF